MQAGGKATLFGLMDYRYRFLSSKLGRFIQPDPVIPGPTYSQAWNRFSYVFNNPLNYVDPSGHVPLMDGEDDAELWGARTLDYMLTEAYDNHGITVTLDDELSLNDKLNFLRGLKVITDTASDDFVDEYLRGETINVEKGDPTDKTCGSHSGGTISLNTGNSKCSSKDWSGVSVHELFHFVDYVSGYKISEAFEWYVGASTIIYTPYYEGYGSVLEVIVIYDFGPEVPPSYGPLPSYPPNRKEDFAESAEEFFGFGWVRIEPDESRHNFISYLLATGNYGIP